MKKLLSILIFAFCFSFVAEAQTTVSIYEIQGQAAASPYDGQNVTTTGVITGMRIGSTSGNIYGYFIQDSASAWNGIYVYDDTHQDIAVGDEITLTAEVSEYYEMTELSNVTALSVNSSGNTVEPVILTAADAVDEAYEGVLVKVNNTTCTEEIDQHGIWTTNDGTGDLKVDDWMYHVEPAVGDVFNITGPMTYDFSERKINPRAASDVEATNSVKVLSFEKPLIAPVPAADFLYIKNIELVEFIQLFDMQGKLIMDLPAIEKIDISFLKTGTYLIILKNEKQTFKQTIMIQ